MRSSSLLPRVDEADGGDYERGYLAAAAEAYRYIEILEAELTELRRKQLQSWVEVEQRRNDAELVAAYLRERVEEAPDLLAAYDAGVRDAQNDLQFQLASLEQENAELRRWIQSLEQQRSLN